MGFIPYSEFKTLVKDIVFPDVEAEELHDTHDSYIQDALINLQTFVPCLRDNNVDFYEKEDFQEWCNTDFGYINRGVVHAVYAFKPGKRCRKLFYEPKSTSFIDNWINQARCVTCNDSTDENDPSRSPLCNDVSDADSYCDDIEEENDCQFRSSHRFYAIGPNDKLILAPRFPCGYTIAVHWEGIKRSYSETEPVPDDTELKIAVAKYVQGQIALFLDRDMPLYDRIMHVRNGDFIFSRADMIHRCTRERRIQDRRQALDGMDVLQPFFYDPLPEEHVFGVVGDYGENNSNRNAVANLIDGWDPEYVVTVGDNWYGSNITEADLIDRTGPVYEALNDDGNFYPTIGNHDRDPVGHLAVEKSHFGIAGKEYRTVRRGLVHFFIIDSGYNNSQVNQQADGVEEDSVQALWLRDQLAASDAVYKIVLLHHPPYTSFQSATTGPTLSNDGYLAYPQLRWPFLEWGAHALINGHIHFYERIQLDGFLYLTNGAGGISLAALGDTPIDGSQIRYNEDFGAIRGRAYRDKLILEFINTSGQVIDSVTIRNGSVPTPSTQTTTVTISSGIQMHFGVGDPNGVVAGNLGDLYKDTSSGEMYVKSSGVNGSNTGWI